MPPPIGPASAPLSMFLPRETLATSLPDTSLKVAVRPRSSAAVELSSMPKRGANDGPASMPRVTFSSASVRMKSLTDEDLAGKASRSATVHLPSFWARVTDSEAPWISTTATSEAGKDSKSVCPGARLVALLLVSFCVSFTVATAAPSAMAMIQRMMT